MRHELAQNVDLENLQERYNGLVLGKAEAHGFNAGVFDGAIAVAKHVQQVRDPDEEVKLLLERKVHSPHLVVYGAFVVQDSQIWM